MITIIDKNKEKHHGRLEIRNVDVYDVELQIMWLCEALEDYDFDKAISYAEELADIIKDYKNDYEIDYERYENGGVDVDYKDFLPKDVKWRYTK